MTEYIDDFKKKYPNLAREIEGLDRLPVKGVRHNIDEAEKAIDSFQGHSPDAIGFLRRCTTDEEGLEIIKYLLDRKEISVEYATELKIQLIKSGISSFGQKKEWGYYR
ncbi:hypothetical protein IPdc08_01038 [archaeon]|nr:hypothetical protein IPdc08_01038 [archaeon]